MKVDTAACPYRLGGEFLSILEREVIKHATDNKTDLTITFANDGYDPVRGGFHPVEIRISSSGVIEYITDFAYVGFGCHSELAKEIDFDFSLGLFQHFGREHPIGKGLELFRVWEQNFVGYYRMGVYQVKVRKG